MLIPAEAESRSRSCTSGRELQFADLCNFFTHKTHLPINMLSHAVVTNGCSYLPPQLCLYAQRSYFTLSSR